jgi:hypothetical protein
VAFVHDQDPVEQLAAQCSDHAFAYRIRPWRFGWTGKNPDAVCGEDRIERPGEPRIPVSEQKVNGGNTITEVHQQIPSGLGGPRTGRVRRHPGQMYPAGTVLDRDQRVNPPKEHGVHVHEIHGQDSLRLHRKELAPSRTRPARCGMRLSGAFQLIKAVTWADALTTLFPTHPLVAVGAWWSLGDRYQSVFGVSEWVGQEIWVRGGALVGGGVYQLPAVGKVPVLTPGWPEVSDRLCTRSLITGRSTQRARDLVPPRPHETGAKAKIGCDQRCRGYRAPGRSDCISRRGLCHCVGFRPLSLDVVVPKAAGVVPVVLYLLGGGFLLERTRPPATWSRVGSSRS